MTVGPTLNSNPTKRQLVHAFFDCKHARLNASYCSGLNPSVLKIAKVLSERILAISMGESICWGTEVNSTNSLVIVTRSRMAWQRGRPMCCELNQASEFASAAPT